MKIQASNSNGLGNRIRCFLSALRMDEEATIYWPLHLDDGMTKEIHMVGRIDPLEDLIETDKSVKYDEYAYQLVKSAYFTKSYEAGNRGLFALYQNFDPRAKKDYINLRRKYLRPTTKVLDMAVSGFKFGFQLRTFNEIHSPPKNQIHNSIINFISDADFPVFVACDNKELRDKFTTNPNVFMHIRESEENFQSDWVSSLAEILTMGGCEILYVTPGSTYGEMGYLFGDYKPIIRSVYDQIPSNDLTTTFNNKFIL